MKFTYFFVCLLWQIGNNLATPIYKHQSVATPNDINDLEADHVKRAMSDVSQTITEVQKILETDPSLPRLTRGEIEALFETVTREEYEKSLKIGDNHRAKHMRALMLVLPYNTNNYSDAKLQELYTRPPITKVIPSEEFKPIRQQQIIVQNDNEGIKTNFRATTYKPKVVSTKTKNTLHKATTFHPKPNDKKATLVKETTTTTTTTAQPSTTTHTQFTTEKPLRFSSHYSAEKPPFPSVQQPPLRENVKDLLATIGLTAEIMPTTTIKPPELTPELKELLNSFGLLTNEEPPPHLRFEEPQEFQEEFMPIYEEFYPQQEEYISNPSVSFLTNDNLTVDEFTPYPVPSPVINPSPKYRMNTAPELNADDFSSFKPLPIPEEQPITSDMEEFFRSYGLLDGSFRHKKSMNGDLSADLTQQSSTTVTTTTTMKTPTTERTKLRKMKKIPDVSVDFLTPDLLSVLDNIGIKNTAQHITAPTFSSVSSFNKDIIQSEISAEENDSNKKTNNLSDFLNTLKKFEKLNKTLTDEDIKSLNLDNFNLSQSLLSQSFGPDPVDDASLENDNYGLSKNAVKRQSDEVTESPSPIRFTLDLQATTEEGFLDRNDNDTVSIVYADSNSSSSIDPVEKSDEQAPTVSTTSTTTTTTEKSEAKEKSSEERQSDLGDSFSGGLDPVTETPLPAPRRNGFYFFSDWNSFLEVGEDPDKVVVRFDPKIGDPSRFLPVTIP